MKIVHVIAGAEIGGAETFAQDAIAALHQRGVQQHVITRPWPGVLARYQSMGIPTTTMQFAPIERSWSAGRRIREIAQGMDADLVHAWMARAASFIPARMPCPVAGWFGDYYNLKYFRRADSCICVTRDIAATMIARGRPPERVFTVNTFGTMPDAPPVSRASLNTPEDALVVVVLSRMHRVKGIDTMLRALAQVPGVYLWLAGEGPERASYENLAHQLGLQDRVRFLGWRNDRKALLQASDICALPSRYEPFGTVIAEAWAMHRPLIATRADGARQYVEHGQTGLLCPTDDPDALADNLLRVVENPALRLQLAQAGHEAYLADFTQDVVTDRLIDCYDTCIRLGPVQ